MFAIILLNSLYYYCYCQIKVYLLIGNYLNIIKSWKKYLDSILIVETNENSYCFRFVLKLWVQQNRLDNEEKHKGQEAHRGEIPPCAMPGFTLFRAKWELMIKVQFSADHRKMTWTVKSFYKVLCGIKMNHSERVRQRTIVYQTEQE